MDEVTTFDGTVATRKDCRFIKGNFYLKNKQCFLINKKWYRINSDYIFYDNDDETWKLKGLSRNIVKGFIGYKNGSFISGIFTINKNRNVKFYYQNSVVLVLDLNVFRDCPNVKEGLNGCYYLTTDSNVPKDFYVKLRPSNRDNYYSFPFNYGSENLIPAFAKTFETDFHSDPLLTDLYTYIERDGFTFGVEFETEKGTIPEHYLWENGLIACRDGSITGFEYVTVPLSGYKGLQAIKSSCALLKKYCSCSPFESLHVHIGGYPRTVKAIAALYRLALLIEDEIYSLFPYHYRDTSKFKRKSYCGPLPRVCMSDDTASGILNGLFMTIGDGHEFTTFPKNQHPFDRSGQHKWEVSPR